MSKSTLSEHQERLHKVLVGGANIANNTGNSIVSGENISDKDSEEVNSNAFRFDWRAHFPIYLTVGVLATLLLLGTRIHEAPVTQEQKSVSEQFAGCFALLKDPFVLLCFLAIVCHVGIDVGTSVTAPKGFWKLLIDRRMYGVDKRFQDLTPVDSSGFEPHMVDPKWTGSQFNVTTVADDAGVERIRDAVIEKESRRTDGGMPTVDYGMDMRQAVSEYDGARFMRDRRTGSEEERRAKANEVLDELRSRGYDDFHITESKTHGHSVYVQDSRGNKFRISDHDVSSARRVLDEIHFGLDDDVKQLADIASMRIDAQNRAADARAEEWKESKELERMASEYWDKVKGQFVGESFGRMDRTYMDMNTFMEKHPDARDVMRKDSNGAYVYEWHEPAKTSYVQKPSLEYKEWLLQEGTSPERDGEDVHFMRDESKKKRNKLKPVDKNYFSDVYYQFRGKAMEALSFLLKRKSGNCLSVFHRKGLGDIDLIWGDKGGGLDHIIDKHVGPGKSFTTAEEAISQIDIIIKMEL